jgi:hypothetical protein
VEVFFHRRERSCRRELGRIAPKYDKTEEEVRILETHIHFSAPIVLDLDDLAGTKGPHRSVHLAACL